MRILNKKLYLFITSTIFLISSINGHSSGTSSPPRSAKVNPKPPHPNPKVFNPGPPAAPSISPKARAVKDELEDSNSEKTKLDK